MSSATLTANRSARTAVQGPRAVVVLLVLAAVLVGWLLSMWFTSTRGVAVTGEVSGTVSVLSASGTKFCLTPADGGDQRCSVLLAGPDSSALAVGQLVRVAIVQIKDGRGGSTEAFVLEPASR